ncbi:hypothetical protein LGR54_13405 [Ancylobacter sp. Lp-2]|uniref:hypothetical protein n=1 Tax=Ancylobacter sp. Lp-2 TaxID=2881339 RepID=UPI001E56363D|nr:hypothetical protein [Ancylobacter sp. Lp-2]MCB4769609.1 hypothetical protein [Ancylobacter sp. Lp-2]
MLAYPEESGVVEENRAMDVRSKIGTGGLIMAEDGFDPGVMLEKHAHHETTVGVSPPPETLASWKTSYHYSSLPAAITAICAATLPALYDVVVHDQSDIHIDQDQLRALIAYVLARQQTPI